MNFIRIRKMEKEIMRTCFNINNFRMPKNNTLIFSIYNKTIFIQKLKMAIRNIHASKYFILIYRLC